MSNYRDRDAEVKPTALIATPGFTRRRLLTGGAALSLGAVLTGRPGGPGRLLAALAAERITGPKLPVFNFSVEREADLVLLDISFYGFTRKRAGEVTSLVPAGPGNAIVVQFPPQAIGEAAYQYVRDPWLVDPPPVLSALSGPSRLCFTLASGQRVDLTTMTAVDLLDWTSWTLLVPDTAQVSATTRSSKLQPGDPRPSGQLTYIEYPYALFLAPTVYTKNTPASGFTTTFTGRTEPLIGAKDVIDCWTAALHQAEVSGDRPRTAEVAAVWARDYQKGSRSVTPNAVISYKP